MLLLVVHGQSACNSRAASAFASRQTFFLSDSDSDSHLNGNVRALSDARFHEGVKAGMVLRARSIKPFGLNRFAVFGGAATVLPERITGTLVPA